MWISDPLDAVFLKEDKGGLADWCLLRQGTMVKNSVLMQRRPSDASTPWGSKPDFAWSSGWSGPKSSMAD